jgi:hypothetical protein
MRCAGGFCERLENMARRACLMVRKNRGMGREFCLLSSYRFYGVERKYAGWLLTSGLR